MDIFRTFREWLTRASDKSEKIEFKTQREAADFVRRVYNENSRPNAALVNLYRRGSAMKQQQKAAS